jgi:hypothetical protein
LKFLSCDVVFFHPDYTVGFGISPNLRITVKSDLLVGCWFGIKNPSNLPPVGNYTPP